MLSKENFIAKLAALYKLDWNKPNIWFQANWKVTTTLNTIQTYNFSINSQTFTDV